MGAEYHLNKMIKAYPDDRFILDIELDGFLTTVRSSLDVLLEDANQYYKFGIPLDIPLNVPFKKGENDYFKEVAFSKNNSNAIKFYDWYQREKGKLSKDPVYKVLLSYEGLRNVSEHRRCAAPDMAKMTMSENISMKETWIIEKYDSTGKLIETDRISDVNESNVTQQLPSTTEWFFSQLPAMGMIQTCQDLLNKLTSFVDDAEYQLTPN